MKMAVSHPIALNRMGSLQTLNNVTSTMLAMRELSPKNCAPTEWFSMITVSTKKSVISPIILIAPNDPLYVSTIFGEKIPNSMYHPCICYICISETPIPSQHCPRQNGYFGHEKTNICDQFYYCVDGMYNMITCPQGLVFNPKTGICTWPDEAHKAGCSSEGIYYYKFMTYDILY